MTDTPFAGEPAHDVEQPLGLGQGQRRRRLVEDQDPAGRCDSALAISTICACAGDSVATFSAGSMATPSSRDQRPRAARASRRRRPGRASCVGCRPAKMFSATESCGTSEPSWWTMPMPSSPAAFSSMSPSSAPSSQDRRLRRAHRPRRRSCRASTCRRRSRRAARGSRRPRRSSTRRRAPARRESTWRGRVDLEPRRHGAHRAPWRCEIACACSAWIIQTIVSLSGVGDAGAGARRRRWRR